MLEYESQLMPSSTVRNRPSYSVLEPFSPVR